MSNVKQVYPSPFRKFTRAFGILNLLNFQYHYFLTPEVCTHFIQIAQNVGSFPVIISKPLYPSSNLYKHIFTFLEQAL